MNAGDARRNQHLRETSFAGRRSQRHSIQQDLRSRCAQKDTAAAAVIQRVAQFFPRCFELCRRPHVPEFIQPRELQQNVQAADKRPRPASLFWTHNCRRRSLPLLTLPFAVDTLLSTVVSHSPPDKPPAARCTHLNNSFPQPLANTAAPTHAPTSDRVSLCEIFPVASKNDSDSTMCGWGASSSPGDSLKPIDAAGNCVMAD